MLVKQMTLKQIVLLFCFLTTILLGKEIDSTSEKKNEVIRKENNGKEKTLKGIYFTSKENFSPLEGIYIDVDSLPDKEAFQKKMNHFLDEKITPQLFVKIKKEALEYFSKRGYRFVYVEIDQKYLNSSVVKVTLINAKLGKISVEGNKYFSEKMIAGQIKTKQNEPISSSRMMKDLYWLNYNPFRSVDLIFEKGKNWGETDVVLEVKEQVPFRVYSTYEHNGYPIAGNSRWSGGINLGNLFYLDQQLNYQFSSASEFDEWHANTMSYIVPFSWRHVLKIYGANAKTKPTLEPDFFLEGKNWEIGARYLIPIITYFSKNNLFLGYEFKRTNNFMSYSEQLVYKKDFDISQFILGYEGSVVDRLGYTAYGLSLFWSPGKMTPYNNNKSFAQERKGADCDYFYFRGNIDRLLKMPHNFCSFFTLLYQFSTTKLLPSEQMSFGGYFSVRGYLENEVIADRGLIFKTELRSCPLSVFKRKPTKDQLQFLAFMDFGYASEVDPNVVKKESTILWSIGPGLRYNYKENVIVRFDYGWQIKSINRIYDEEDRRSRLHCAITIGF
jgi:hemolysin activation/secretion protein